MVGEIMTWEERANGIRWVEYMLGKRQAGRGRFLKDESGKNTINLTSLMNSTHQFTYT